jgi:hypothetical protein
MRVAPAPKPATDVRVPLVQRKCACSGGSKCRCDERVQMLAEPGAPATAAPAQRRPLVVDDDAAAEPGQARKTELLERLRRTACAAADEELARVGRDTSACPYLERVFTHYADRPAAELEHALVGWAPEAARATSASDYLPVVAERSRGAARRWAETGELPSGLGPDRSPQGVLGAVLGRFGALSGVASLFAKDEPGATAGRGADATTVRSHLRGGTSLDPTTRTRMETALGHDFSQVRVHADPSSGAVARQLSARAFTVGHDVAFAPGEYRPGTLAGDAVLAHELAHVVQQRGATAEPGEAGRQALEDDADTSAAHAVASMNGLGEASVPRLRSGLRLQRCATTQTHTLPSPAAREALPQSPAGRELQDRLDAQIPGQRCTQDQITEIRALVGPASTRMQRAVRAIGAPEANASLIRAHFGSAGTDPGNLATILSRYQRALDVMTSGDFAYFCQDFTQPPCRQPGKPQRLAGTSPRMLPMTTGWCGTPGATPFLSPDVNDWVRTMVHESFHPLPEFLSGNDGAGPRETYREQPGVPYPGETAHALINPDNYAWFATEAP